MDIKSLTISRDINMNIHEHEHETSMSHIGLAHTTRELNGNRVKGQRERELRNQSPLYPRSPERRSKHNST